MTDVENKEVAGVFIPDHQTTYEKDEGVCEPTVPLVPTVEDVTGDKFVIGNEMKSVQTALSVAKGISDTLAGLEYHVSADQSYQLATQGGFGGTAEEWDLLQLGLKSVMPKTGHVEKTNPTEEEKKEYRSLRFGGYVLEDGQIDIQGLIQKGREVRDSRTGTFDRVAGKVLSKTDVKEINTHLNSLFDNAMELSQPPVINQEVSGKYGWAGNIKFPHINQLYPIPLVRCGRADEVDPAFLRKVDALVKFYEALVDGPHDDLRIFTFQDLIGSTEATWIRYQTDIGSVSFVVETSKLDRWATAMMDDENMAWCLEENTNSDFVKKGYTKNVTKRPDIIELPLSVFECKPSDHLSTHPDDDLLNGDFQQLDLVVASFQDKLRVQIGKATQIAGSLAKLPVKKDHDLYLIFQSDDEHKHLKAILEKVPPLLPEGGELRLGSNPAIDFELMVKDSKGVEIVFKRLNTINKTMHRLVTEARNRLRQHPTILELFRKEVVQEYLAAAHFMKKLYGFQGSGNPKLVEDVANDIIRVLTKKHRTVTYPVVSDDSVVIRDLGLDIESWIVWEYELGKEPVKAPDPELNFKDHIFNRYTDSFVHVLHAYLMNLGNPLIKPYSSFVPADLSDGHPVGSIRIVK